MSLVLSPSFYQRNTKAVARALLGKKLVRIYKGERLSGIITEVEAYMGIKDKAAHVYGGRRTLRTEAMYAAGGISYVYLIYGMYYCLNAVTEKKEVPQAVLVRSLEPLEGIKTMQALRKNSNIKNLTTGPGKLTQAMHITKSENGLSLGSDALFIEEGITVSKSNIIKTTRIGVDYAGDHAAWPLRFYIKDNSFISKK